MDKTYFDIETAAIRKNPFKISVNQAGIILNALKGSPAFSLVDIEIIC